MFSVDFWMWPGISQLTAGRVAENWTRRDHERQNYSRRNWSPVSLVSCCTDCKWSRMPLLVLLPEPRGTSIWCQFCAVCTGYLFGIGSRSRQQSPCTSVSTVWRRRTSQSTARRRHPLLVVVTWDLPTLARSSFLARGQVKDKSNLACRLITRGTNERNVKIGQRGSERGHVTFEILGPSPYLWNSWS